MIIYQFLFSMFMITRLKHNTRTYFVLIYAFEQEYDPNIHLTLYYYDAAPEYSLNDISTTTRQFRRGGRVRVSYF